MKLFSWLLGSVRVEGTAKQLLSQKGREQSQDKINKKEDEVQGAAVRGVFDSVSVMKDNGRLVLYSCAVLSKTTYHPDMKELASMGT